MVEKDGIGQFVSHDIRDRYTTKSLYAAYIILLIVSILVLIGGLFFQSYVCVIISIPVIFTLVDALFTDKTVVHIPPLMIFIMIILMILLLLGKVFVTGYIIDTIADLLFGIALGLAGLIMTYSLLSTIPGVRDEKPFLTAFVSLSLALSLFTILETVQYVVLMLMNQPNFTINEFMAELAPMVIGALFVSILFYLNKKNGLFKYTVTKYMESNPGTISINEYDIQEIRKSIRNGESENVEYKSTLRTNLATGEKDPRMEKAILKTLVAFLNSNGGTLLVGVSDDGTIIGIDENSFDNRDKMNLHMTNLISSQIGNEFLPFISFKLVDIDEKCVMRVVCKKSDTPVFLTEGKTETFFVRSGPSSIDINGMNLLNYVKNRFKNSKNRKN